MALFNYGLLVSKKAVETAVHIIIRGSAGHTSELLYVADDFASLAWLCPRVRPDTRGMLKSFEPRSRYFGVPPAPSLNHAKKARHKRKKPASGRAARNGLGVIQYLDDLSSHLRDFGHWNVSDKIRQWPSASGRLLWTCNRFDLNQ
jgi:hypothetical protein